MYGRKKSPYSRIEQIDSNRSEMIFLVLAAVGLAVCVNLFTSFVYDWISPADEGPSVWATVIGLVCAAVAVVLVLYLAVRLSRQQTEVVKLDVAVPYVRYHRKNVDVQRQHPHRPQYAVVKWVFDAWRGRWADDRDGLNALTDDWEASLHGEESAKRRPVQFVLRDNHLLVIEALILAAINRYCRESLEPGLSFVYSWQADLEAEEYHLDDLPAFWRENPYVLGWLRRDRDIKSFNLSLPKDVRIHRTCTEERCEITLRRKRCGTINIAYYRKPWVDARGQPAKVFSDGLNLDAARHADGKVDYYVFGTRLESRASFEFVYASRNDVFYEWAARLLASLEEQLDYKYFLQARVSAIISDIPWKIGELPADGSLWSKLDAIEQKQEEILARVQPPVSLVDDAGQI